MQLSADQVLAEAGYLPRTSEKRPDIPTLLRTQYKLSPADLQLAMSFLEFLARGKKRPRRPRAETEARK